jgi:hypothetical protein
MKHCMRCQKKIVEPNQYVELPVSGWRHGVPGTKSNPMYLHLGCALGMIQGKEIAG